MSSPNIPTANRRIGILTAMVQERLAQMALITPMILTPTLAPEVEGVLRTIHRSQFNARADVKHTDDGKFNRIKMRIGQTSYNCEEQGLEAAVARRLRRQYLSEIDFQAAQAFQVARTVQLEREVRLKALIHNTTTFPLSGSTGIDVSTAWSSISADIIGDIKSMKNLRAAQGIKLDSMQVSLPTWNNMWANTGIRSSFINTTPATAPGPDNAAAKAMLAATLGLNQIVVGDAVYSGDHDESSPAMTPLWGEVYAFMFEAAPANDPSGPGLGRLMYWQTENGDGAGLGISEYYSENQSRGEVVRFVENVDEVIISSDYGGLLKID